MAQVTGVGGVFLRTEDPESLYAWYEQQLGLTRQHGCFNFEGEGGSASLVMAFFPKNAEYFPVTQPAMLNLHVDDLDAVLDRLAASGVAVDPKREKHAYGWFGWFTDPAGNRVELWQAPPKGD